MSRIPRRYSHFLLGPIQSGLTCAVAAGISSAPFSPFALHMSATQSGYQPSQSASLRAYDTLTSGAAMRRREFITLLGGAAAAWPISAHAQQTDRVRRIGVLFSLAATDPELQTRKTAFEQGLQELGWTDGRNVRIDYRWGAGDAANVRKYAAELIALAPDVILVSGGSVVGQLLQLTHTVPVVFTQTPDPVGWQIRAATLVAQ